MEGQIKKKPWYKKWWIWLIIVFVIGAIGSLNQDEERSSNDNKNKETQTKSTVAQPEEKPIAVDAVDLWNEYDENEVSADQKYKNKQLEVTGKIDDIGKDIFDSIYITLKTDDMIGSVQVYFSDKDAESVAKLAKGDKVTVVGKGSGKSLTNVIIKKATIN